LPANRINGPAGKLPLGVIVPEMSLLGESELGFGGGAVELAVAGVGVGDDAGVGGGDVGGLELARRGAVGAESLAGTEEHGVDHQVVLVDEVVLGELVTDLGAAVDHDLAALLLLDLGNLLSQITLDQTGVVPID